MSELDGKSAPPPAGQSRQGRVGVLAYTNGFTLWTFAADLAEDVLAPGFFGFAFDSFRCGDVILVSYPFLGRVYDREDATKRPTSPASGFLSVREISRDAGVVVGPANAFQPFTGQH